MLRSFLAAGLCLMGLSLGGAAADPLRFTLVTHSPESDTYWVSVSRGLQQAGKDLGVNVQYRGTDKNLNDPNQQRRNLEAAIASKPDGLIISDPTPGLAKRRRSKRRRTPAFPSSSSIRAAIR